MALWQHVLSHYPESTTAHYNLGQGFLALGDSARAERSFRSVLEVDERHAYALNELGTILSSRGYTREVERLFRSSVESDPDYFPARYNLAITLERRNGFEAARPHYEAFVRLAPDQLWQMVGAVQARLEAR